MQFQKVVFLDEDLASRLAKYCTVQPPAGELWMGEDETYSITVTFPNQYAMELKACGVKREEGGDNTVWTEALLFDVSGRQVACSEPGDTLEDTWELADFNGNTYFVEVRRKSTPADMCKHLYSIARNWQMEDGPGYRVASLRVRLSKEGFLEYVRESFSVAPEAYRLIENIVEHVCARRLSAAAQLNLMKSLLDGTIGLTEEELKMLETAKRR